MPSLGVRRKHSPLNLIHCNNWAKTKPDFTRMVPFQMVSDSPDLHSRWPLLLKISFFIAYYCFISNINWSCMKIRGSTFLLSFSMKYFFQPIYSNYVNKAVFDKKKNLNLLIGIHWRPTLSGTVHALALFIFVCDSFSPRSRWPLLLKYFFELLITA